MVPSSRARVGSSLPACLLSLSRFKSCASVLAFPACACHDPSEQNKGVARFPLGRKTAMMDLDMDKYAIRCAGSTSSIVAGS